MHKIELLVCDKLGATCIERAEKAEHSNLCFYSKKL